MEYKLCQGYTTTRLANGEIKKYPVMHRYKVNNKYVIAEEIQNKIFERASNGIPATKIAQEVGISVERVRRLINKRKKIVFD